MEEQGNQFKKVVRNIVDNYLQEEQSIVKQLFFKCDHHGTSIGSLREEIWKQLFEQIIPKKFTIEQSVFIIDSNGENSREVDLAIFDEMYTPYIFRYGRLKFLPIEAVAVVVECKSKRPEMEALKKWAESIDILRTSQKSYTRIVNCIVDGEKDCLDTTQTSTRPLKILCCLDEKDLVEIKKYFDFILVGKEVSSKIEIINCQEETTLQYWYKQLNHGNGLEDEINKKELEKSETENKANFRKSLDKQGECIKDKKLEEYTVKLPTQKGQEEEEISLLSFNFKLNQLLMLVNNPIFFPHKAYVDMFNKYGRE